MSSNHIYFSLTLHNHQPVGNFDFVFEKAYQMSYLPMLEALERHPTVRVGVHNTGCLLDWLVKAHPEYIDRLAELAQRKQVEILSGGYYEPILVSLPDQDKLGQIQKLNERVESLFGVKPKGAWLAERVWEPHLPKILHEAGVDYTIVDDTHFRYAGLQNDDMYSYYVTEEQGNPLKIFGTAQHLRYTVPWLPVNDVIGWFKQEAERDLPQYNNTKKIAVMGDDGEKFGLWPRTYDHCWTNGWVEQLFTAFEENSDWLKTITLGDYAENHPSQGQIYLPAASYDEMTEWALPAEDSANIIHLKHELQDKKDTKTARYVKGGLWRYFQVKYPEVNLMNKRALAVSKQVHAMAEGADKESALEKLWAAQCNCGYWHGLFGGIYLFHIRGANYRNLIDAELLANGGNVPLSIEEVDYTVDGCKNVVMNNRDQFLLFDPIQGGSLLEWDFRKAPYNLLNGMSRREEGYHRDLAAAAEAGNIQLATEDGELENVHGGGVKVQEFGLENKLIYDWYRRGALQDRFLNNSADLNDYYRTNGEIGDFVNQPYTVETKQLKSSVVATLSRDGGVWQDDQFVPVQVQKQIKLANNSSQFTVTYTITNLGDRSVSARFGVENNYGLEGGNSEWTYLEGLDDADGNRPHFADMTSAENRTAYTIGCGVGTVQTKIDASWKDSGDVWWFPIETVTNSENGYESNYQGTAMMISWPLNLDAGASWTQTLTFKLKAF